MAGDFNTPSNHLDDSHPTCHAKGNELLDIISAKRPGLLNKDGQHTWRQAECSSLLDLVFVMGEISDATTIHEGGALEASNHRPLWWNIPKLGHIKCSFPTHRRNRPSLCSYRKDGPTSAHYWSMKYPLQCNKQANKYSQCGQH